MLTTLIALAVAAVQIVIVAVIALWCIDKKFVAPIARYAHILLPLLFFGGVLGSLYFSDIKGYAPCLLCWWQRIFIFGIALLSLTGDIRKRPILQRQVMTFSIIGGGIAILHNIIDIFPTGLDVCGANGPSCLARYVYEFGYITIPMMSLTLLVGGFLIALIAKRFPQQ